MAHTAANTAPGAGNTLAFHTGADTAHVGVVRRPMSRGRCQNRPDELPISTLASITGAETGLLSMGPPSL